MTKWTALLILLSVLGCAPTVTHLREPGMETFGEVSKSLVIGKTSKDDIYKRFGIPTTKIYFSSELSSGNIFTAEGGSFNSIVTLGLME